MPAFGGIYPFFPNAQLAFPDFWPFYSSFTRLFRGFIQFFLFHPACLLLSLFPLCLFLAEYCIRALSLRLEFSRALFRC